MIVIPGIVRCSSSAAVGPYTPSDYLYYEDTTGKNADDVGASARFVPYNGYTSFLPIVTSDATAPAGNGHAWRWHWSSTQWSEGGGQDGLLNENVYDTLPTFVEGKTIYQGFYFKLQRVGAVDIYNTGIDEDFDKVFELNFIGGRWILLVGSRYNVNLTQGKYTATLETANAGGSGEPSLNTYSTNAAIFDGDVIFHNQAPYSKDDPYEFDYDTWNKIVIEITLSKTANGVVKLTFNDTVVLNQGGLYTIHPSFSGVSNVYHFLFGTCNQPLHTQIEHYKWVDKWLITDSLAEMQAAGYL